MQSIRVKVIAKVHDAPTQEICDLEHGILEIMQDCLCRSVDIFSHPRAVVMITLLSSSSL